jgi:outer membrane lipoprotein-sorting protein
MLRQIALIAVATLPLAAQSLDDAYARIDKAAAQFKSVVADIKRDVHTAVINDDERDQGNIKVLREKGHDTKMLIQFTGTDAKSVAIDGSQISLYTPKEKLVQVYDIGAKKDVVDQFLLLGFGASSKELKDSYNISFAGMEAINGEDTWHLQLVPKSAEALKNLKKAELWISQQTGLPIQQKFTTSSGGDFHLVTYSNMKQNAPLSDNVMKLNLPRGVKTEHPKL